MATGGVDAGEECDPGLEYDPACKDCVVVELPPDTGTTLTDTDTAPTDPTPEPTDTATGGDDTPLGALLWLPLAFLLRQVRGRWTSGDTIPGLVD